MFNHILDRSEELVLLDLAITTSKSNKVLIAELEAFEVEIKKNGQIHKTKENRRLKLIKDLKKENAKLKKFFVKHNVPEPEYFDYHRYQYRKEVHEKRKHLYTEAKAIHI